MYRSEMERDQNLFTVLVREDKITGYLCAYTVADECHILKIAVEPESRRQGLGRMLMKDLTDRSAEKGANIMWLEVRQSNWEARAFYQALGFDELGLRKRYYSDTGEDAVVMMKRMNE